MPTDLEDRFCPLCKVDWLVVKGMLNSAEPEEWDMAHKIIQNCPICLKHFEEG